MLRICLLAPAFLAITSFASPAIPAPTQRACLWASEVTGFDDAGANRVLVHIGKRATWELTLSPGCPDADWALRIGIRSRGGERICPGRPAELIVPDASGSSSRSCLVRSIRKLPAPARTGAPER